MQRFEFFHPADAPAGDPAAAVLASGGVLAGGTGYRAGSWRDPATGARAVIDLGPSPLEDDPQHPPRAYAGWLPLELALQVPLVGPHWLAVEAHALIERVLAALPGARALDVEDVAAGPDAEPTPWSRLRALASWERQHAAQIASRTDLGRMSRSDSLRLWRWRRERDAGAAAHPSLHWPAPAVARTRDGTAHLVALWPDPQRPCALPATGLVLVALAEPRLVPRAALPGGEPLDQAGASAVAAPPSWPAGLDRRDYAACLDEEWCD